MPVNKHSIGKVSHLSQLQSGWCEPDQLAGCVLQIADFNLCPSLLPDHRKPCVRPSSSSEGNGKNCVK